MPNLLRAATASGVPAGERRGPSRPRPDRLERHEERPERIEESRCAEYNPRVPSPVSRARALPRDLAELKALAERHPELAPAARLQAELVAAVRRVQSRLSTPWIETPPDALAARLAEGRALLDFDAVAFDWGEVRLLVRQVTDILRRHDAIDGNTAAALHALGRSPDLPEAVRAWFEGRPVRPSIEMVDEVLAWAARPYLERTAEVLHQRVGFEAWQRPACPVCGAPPELAVVLQSGARQLACGRCHARWPFDATACPYCGTADRTRLSMLATEDGVYRVQLCDACGRYLKAIDTRRAARPLLPYVDAIAMLPLDAAVMQRGLAATKHTKDASGE